ncbi:MAG: DNA polymerase III subunit beta [Oscillospiraceae bacterium]|nr:DNA polymerase III subunit beta [Oscillospiraceae bacterium]
MDIICDRDILNEAVTPALYAVSSKNTNQLLECFLLSADKEDGVLTICGYDLEKGIKVTLSGDGITIKEGGKIIINAAKFSSIVRNLPGGDVLISSGSEFGVTIGGGRSEFNLHGFDGETFPLIPELKGEKNFKINRKILKNMITSTHFAIGVNNARPSLNGALFEIRNNGLNIIAIDGNRLALRRSFDGVVPDPGEGGETLELGFIVPGKSLSELLKLIGDEDETAEIELTKKHFIISFDNIIYFSRLIESEFLDYKRSIKIDPKTTVAIDTKNFTESVERASLITDDRQKTLIKLKFKKEEINIENKENYGVLEITSAAQLGKATDECDIEIYDENIEIGFNHRYLLDALKAVREDKILLKFESPTKPMVILPYEPKDENGEDMDISGAMDTENSKFLYLVLPIRMRD